MTLTIGQVAAAAAVNIQTIRHYERQALFTAPRRVLGSAVRPVARRLSG
jgi:DNA-binding transcriptional MerR regulator